MTHDTFPGIEIPAGTVFHRMHCDGLGPFFFGNSGTMRFDPDPDHLDRFGSCYVAGTRIACILEVLGDLRPIPRFELEARKISTAELAKPVRLANILDRSTAGKYNLDGSFSAGRIALTANLVTMTPGQRERDTTRFLASARFDEGFDGVLYKARHDPKLELTAVALFASPPGIEHPEFFTIPKTTDVLESDEEQLRDEFGYTIFD